MSYYNKYSYTIIQRKTIPMQTGNNITLQKINEDFTSINDTLEYILKKLAVVCAHVILRSHAYTKNNEERACVIFPLSSSFYDTQ